MPTATADILVDSTPHQTTAQAIRSSVYAGALLPTMALVNDRAVWVPAAARSTNLSPEVADKSLSVAAVPGSLLLQVTARYPDPRVATVLANAGAAALAESLDRGSWTQGDVIRARQVTRASGVAAAEASSPGGGTIHGAAAGLGVGAALSLLIAFFDQTVRKRFVSSKLGVRLLDIVSSRRTPGEAARADAVAIDLLWSHRAAHGAVILVAPADRRSGATSARALATSCAELGHRTCLVDLDVRHRTLTKQLGLDNRPGVTDLVTGHASPEQVQPDPAGSFCVVAAGRESPTAAPITGSLTVRALLEDLRGRFDAVILASAPAAEDSAVLDLATSSDAVVVAARERRTAQGDVAGLVQTLRSASAPWRGLLVLES